MTDHPKWREMFEFKLKREGIEYEDEIYELKYKEWLKRGCDYKGERRLNMNKSTDGHIWNILDEAFLKEYITSEMAVDLLHFRNVTFDMFHLLD